MEPVITSRPVGPKARNHGLLGLSLAVALAAPAASAVAQTTLAPMTVDTKVEFTGSTPGPATVIDNSRTGPFPGQAQVKFDNTFSSPTLGFMSASLEARPTIFLTASATAADTALVADAISDITYEFEVNSPTGDGLVPITVLANFYTEVLNTGLGQEHEFAQANLGVTQAASGLDDVIGVCAEDGQMPCAQTFGSFSETFMVMANTPIEVEERVFTNASRGGTAIATADPMFSIGADFLANNPDASLSFSDGVSNAAPAPLPEPQTWAMMALGFFGFGAALRGSRRRAQPAA